VPIPPDAAGALIADLTQRVEALRHSTFAGRDDQGLVEATVDGGGIVSQIKLARTITRHRPAEVGEAIVRAIDDAQTHLASAYAELARDAETWENEL
jgi:DNA-binding protein YbaB